MTIHGGIVHFAIHAHGITGHLSQIEKTVNAVLKMAKVFQALPTCASPLCRTRSSGTPSPQRR